MWITTTCASAIILCWRQPQWLSDCAKWQSCSHQTRDLNSTCTTEEGLRSGKWLVISAEILLATIHYSRILIPGGSSELRSLFAAARRAREEFSFQCRTGWYFRPRQAPGLLRPYPQPQCWD